MTEVGEGIFFTTSPEEAETIYTVLKDCGYEQSGNGVKEFLLDAIHGEVKEPEKEETFTQKLAKDPDAAIQTAKTLFDVFMKIKKASPKRGG